MTTETREHAVTQLRKCQQGNKTIEEYVIEFRGWANLAGFDEIALVDQFKKGIKVALGRKIMELGSPGDGSTAGQLEAWYNRAIELERQYRESERYYGKKEFKITKKTWNDNRQAGPSQEKPKTETITVKVKDENAMDVDKTQTTRPPPKCYNCGKIGHIAKNCRGKTAVRAMGVQEYFGSMTDEEKEEMRRQLGFVKN